MNDICFYCGVRPTEAADHVVPQSSSGPDEEWNFLPSCKKCNSRKGTTDILTFLRNTGCWEEWGLEKKEMLINKLRRGKERGYVAHSYIGQICNLIGISDGVQDKDFSYGTTHVTGVGLKIGEIDYLDMICEKEQIARNALMRFAIVRFLKEYQAGGVDLAAYFEMPKAIKKIRRNIRPASLL